MNRILFSNDLRWIRPVAGALVAWLPVAWLIVSACALAQEGQSGNPRRRDSLAESQQRLAEKYDRLELLVGRLAELSRATQPRRAKLLRELVAKSREQDVPGQFDNVVAALRKDRLATAVEGQGELQTELQRLLDLLLQEDRDRQIEAERKRIAKYLADLKRLIRLQRGIKARTEGGDDQAQLTEDQQRTAQATGKLFDQIHETEGSPKSSDPEQGDSPEDSKPSDGKPSDGKPNDGKPSDGKPSDGKPSDGKQSSGQPSDSSEGGSSGGEQSQESQPQ